MTYEYRVFIHGIAYGMKDLKSLNIMQPLFDTLSVGNACAAELTMTFWPVAEIPRMEKVIPEARERGSGDWVKLGEFFIDTRSTEGSAMTIVAYDRMLMAEPVWVPDDTEVFPMPMREAAEKIAQIMGTMLDQRCEFNDSYTIDYPTEKTMRDVLKDIAGAHLGNWIITNNGELLLVPLFGSMPPETHYLITEEGKAITLGGVRILV